jgi:hypothetical protein
VRPSEDESIVRSQRPPLDNCLATPLFSIGDQLNYEH